MACDIGPFYLYLLSSIAKVTIITYAQTLFSPKERSIEDMHKTSEAKAEAEVVIDKVK